MIVSKEGARPISETYTSRRPKGYRKALAQYFLTDQRVLSYILEAADLSSDDTVVEVGPGRGILTRQLAKLARRVVAVEIDAALAAGLATKLGNPPNLTVLEADARTADIQPDVPYKLVANLPYYAANPIIRRFLEMERQPLRMVVMVQKEVAHSMTATPGRMTLLSVAVQFYGMPRLVCVVPPSAFRPSPKVDSAVVCIDVKPEARGGWTTKRASSDWRARDSPRPESSYGILLPWGLASTGLKRRNSSNGWVLIRGVDRGR